MKDYVRIPLSLGQFRNFKDWTDQYGLGEVILFDTGIDRGSYQYSGLNHQGDAVFCPTLIPFIRKYCRLGFVHDRIQDWFRGDLDDYLDRVKEHHKVMLNKFHA